MVYVGYEIRKINDYEGLKILGGRLNPSNGVIELWVEWEDKFTRQMIGDLAFYFRGETYCFVTSHSDLEIPSNGDILVCMKNRYPNQLPEYELKFCPIHNKWSLVCTK